MTKIKLYSRHDKCNGTGEHEDDEFGLMPCPFPDCDNGKTVMEFVEDGDEYCWIGDIKDSPVKLIFGRLGDIEISDVKDKDITDSLNPLYLEFIEEQECPECEGTKEKTVKGKIVSGAVWCPNCKIEGKPNSATGKVEVVTGKYIFKEAELKESE